MAKLAIHLENGSVSRVDTDDDRFGGVEVVVVVDQKPVRLMRPTLDAAVGQYIESVRGIELSHRLKEICGTIACLFDAASQSKFEDPHQALNDIKSRLQQANELVESVKKETGWRGGEERKLSVLRPIQRDDLVQKVS